MVVPLYHAAFQYDAYRLLKAATFYILQNYLEIVDEDHNTLIHILENVTSDYCSKEA